MLHLDRVDAEARDLIALMRRQRADADLHEPRAQLLFHDARERAGVRKAIALEFVIEIAVRVDVQDGDRRDAARDRAHDRIGDRVIAAERDRAKAVLEHRVDARLNHGPRGCGIVAEREIAGIGQAARGRRRDSVKLLPAGDVQAPARISGGAAAAPRRNDELAS